MPRTLADQFELTHTEQDIFCLLQDGNLHSRDEVLNCLREKYRTDDDGKVLYVTIQNHLSRIRKKVMAKGYQIDCVLSKRKINYRLSRNIRSNKNEN